jgi:hypothetical protein
MMALARAIGYTYDQVIVFSWTADAAPHAEDRLSVTVTVIKGWTWLCPCFFTLKDSNSNPLLQRIYHHFSL